MIRNILATTRSAFVAAAGLLVLGALSDAAAEPALWKVSDADSALYLFGSVHSLPDETPWRTDALKAAMDDAETVFFEAPMDLFSQGRLQTYLTREGLNPPGLSLSSQLDPATSAQLYRVARDLGLDPLQLETVKPWFAVMIFSAKLAEAGGADPSNGVDQLLSIDALRAGKEIRTFETLEQQAGFIADLAPDVQIEVLELTIAEADQADAEMTTLVQSWVEGDLDALERQIFESMASAPPSFTNTLFRHRNEAWAEELDAYLAGAGKGLVVVGAGHLVGEHSLVTLLRDQGWAVERVE